MRETMTHRTYAIAVGALWVEQYWTHDRSCTLIAIDIIETDLELDPAEAQAGREANR